MPGGIYCAYRGMSGRPTLQSEKNLRGYIQPGQQHDRLWQRDSDDLVTLRLWDAFNGRTIGRPLVGYTTDIHGVAFSSDGKTSPPLAPINSLAVNAATRSP